MTIWDAAMHEMTALQWLTAIAEHTGLSSEAKEAAAIMSEGWTGCGSRCRRGMRWVLERSRLADYEAVDAAAQELRDAGFLTGRGISTCVWKLHSPANRLPLMEAQRRRQQEVDEARRLERKLQMALNGGSPA